MSSATPTVFEPQPGQRHWWEGDPGQIPLLAPTDDDPALIRRRGVLSPAQCDLLTDCFERNHATSAARTGDDWDGRFIWQNQLPATELEALRIMQQARFITHVIATQSVKLPQGIYSDTSQVVRWLEGVAMDAHADNLFPDGSPNKTSHRCLSSIIYLNDDYEGGETYFPGLGVRVRPERGSLLLFGSGRDYVHGVTEVRRGRRYTYAGWFTFDPAFEDASARIVY